MYNKFKSSSRKYDIRIIENLRSEQVNWFWKNIDTDVNIEKLRRMKKLFSLRDAGFSSRIIYFIICPKFRPLGYEWVYLSLCKVADALFHIQGDEW